MTVTAIEQINAPCERVWAVVTDFDNIASNITAITDAIVLERADAGIIGLKWQETRLMFGKSATETMWISSAEEGRWYETTAHNCGSIYHSKILLKEHDGGTHLSMSFSATPETLTAKVFSLLGFMFSGAIKKAFQEDLKDIKRVCESEG